MLRGMEIVFSLCLPRDEATVPAVRHLCRDALRGLGVKPECVAEIELAVTEACTNVLKHVAETQEEYRVEVQVSEQQCDISVIDDGHGFEHEGVGLEGPAEVAESGRGIFLMRAMVDKLHFASKPESGTIVHLVKKLELADESILKVYASAS